MMDIMLIKRIKASQINNLEDFFVILIAPNNADTNHSRTINQPLDRTMSA